LSDEYFKQLTGEICEQIQDKEGRSKYKWIKKYPDVEALDCLVYVLGLHTILNMHKWSDERWDGLATYGEIVSGKKTKVGVGESFL
jgi:phage terminase large subunit GpA-like protein